MMKRKLALLLLPFVGVLAACGGSDDDNNDEGLPLQPPGRTFYGVQGDQLVIGDVNNASRAARRTITGVTEGTIVAIDIRPANGQLYGISSEDQLYTIDSVTGIAGAVGPRIPGLSGDRIGFDFNPTVDRIRIIADDGTSIRVNPDTGEVAGTDTPISDTEADIVAVAYTNNVVGGGTTTLFGLDANRNELVRIGGPDGTPSPNTGVITSIGPIRTDLGGELGFDIVSANEAYYVDTEDGDSRVFRLDLATGGITETSRFDGEGIDALAVAG